VFIAESSRQCPQNLRVHGLIVIARWAELPLPLNSCAANEAIRNEFFRNVFPIGEIEEASEEEIMS